MIKRGAFGLTHGRTGWALFGGFHGVLPLAAALILLLAWPLAEAAETQPRGAPTGLQSDVVFTDYSPLSGAVEVTRRLMSPLNARRVSRGLQRSGKAMREQSIDLRREKFAVYVPEHAPPEGYSLLVFVPPWREAAVPRPWVAALERHGMIYVSAANSGNDADVLDRREPLALLAAANIMQRYPIAPGHVFVGGFSGGSRVALRIALGYPDVFSGVFLDAGSDPIGSAEIPLPPADLFQQFRESTRLVYLTGGHDDFHLQQDKESRQSLERWCVLDLITVDTPWIAHEIADTAAFNCALDALEQRKAPLDKKLDPCRARVAGELSTQLHQVADMIAGGRMAAAKVSLLKIDARYGGLAAPRSVELADASGTE